MDEEVRREKGDEEFERKQEDLKRRDEAKTNRNKAKREKMKARKQNGKSGSGVDSGEGKEKVKPGLAKGADKGAKLQNGVGMKAAPASPNGNVLSELVASSEGIGMIIHDDD